MILTDAGPLIALLDRNDPNHARCLAVAQSVGTAPMLTTLPCLTEAMYFVEKEGGYTAQRRLWDMQARGLLVVHAWDDAEFGRMKTLMEKYQDAPMDFADASLVVAAETLSVTRIFTLDAHFYAYRILDKTPFDVLP